MHCASSSFPYAIAKWSPVAPKNYKMTCQISFQSLNEILNSYLNILLPQFCPLQALDIVEGPTLQFLYEQVCHT